jgi:hypothetical protein
LLEHRALILSTLRGLKQLKVEGKSEGGIFKNERLGVLVCMPPLWDLVGSIALSDIYRPKVQRAMREAGILK